MSFFQKSVVSKYLNNLNKETVSSAFLLFKEHFLNPHIQKNIRELNEEQYQQGFFNDLFVKVLGYILSPNSNFNLLPEYKNEKDSKKADGAIVINGNVRAVIELKDTKTMDLGKVETQAFGYKNAHKDCPYVIVSNFEKLRLYVDNYTEFIEFNLFTLSEEDFTLLYLILSFESIEKDIPKKLKDETVNQDDITTKKLYNDYSVFKKELFQNLIAKNPNFDKLTLFKKSQKLIDRLLFIFFAEDRGLLPPNSVRQIIQDWQKLGELDSYSPLYSRFQKFFGYLNTGYQSPTLKIFAYNGGLFEPDEVLDSISIDDEILNENTLRLSRYDFETEVDVNILGHIFEHSLNEIEEIQSELEGKIADKSKSKRKKDGIFYTPKYITKYIVENTLGTLCSEKRIEFGLNDDETEETKRKAEKKDLLERIDSYRKWLLELTICDPACGSGAFLNQALDFLLNEHRRLDELTARTLDLPIVFSDIENSVLENNIFGVDINEEAVEIAKLSLWLKTAEKGRKLSDLSKNIKCGNSLIDDQTVAGDKAFNWQEEFPQIFAKGGFDVVIGNPPYGAKITKQDFEFFITKYRTANYKLDTFSLFIEKSLEIINDEKMLGLIVPYTWLTIQQHSKLRKHILDFNLKQIINLPTKIFSDADLDTVIVIIRKDKIGKEINIGKIYSNEIKLMNTISYDNIKSSSELIINLNIDNVDYGILDKIKRNGKLNEFFDVSQGYIPYRRSDLIIEYGEKEGNRIVDNRLWHSQHKISEDYKQEIQGKDISRYYYCESFQFIKYGKHLAGYVDPKYFQSPRILIMEVTRGDKYILKSCYVEKEFYNTPSIINIISKNNEIDKLKFLLTIINSILFSWFHKKVHPKANAITSIPKILVNDVRNLPIPNITHEAQQPFIEKADLMLNLNKDLQEGKNAFISFISGEFNLDKISTKLEEWYNLPFDSFTKELEKLKVKLTSTQKYDLKPLFDRESAKLLAIKTEIETTDREIDQMVYKLYDLTPEEIKIVEGE